MTSYKRYIYIYAERQICLDKSGRLRYDMKSQSGRHFLELTKASATRLLSIVYIYI